MDELVLRLADDLTVDGASPDADTDRLAGRRAFYKHEARLTECQATRRAEQLDRQKRERDDQLDRLRAIVADDDECSIANDMDTAALPAVFGYKKKEYHQPQYANQLMFSEWMEEPPDDLETNWLFKLCPPGKRCLVVARRRCTRAYSASGALLRTFPSALPGGCRSGTAGQHRSTVLDCVWHVKHAAYHVLDVLCWNGHDVTECEADFRFSWLRSKLAETPAATDATRRNPYRFNAIADHPAAPVPLQTLAVNPAATAAADGVLFFHRAAHYQPGSTPLVLWLKPFMLPEAVALQQVTPEQLGAPTDYASRARYIADFEEVQRRRRRRRRHGSGRQQKMQSTEDHSKQAEQTTVKKADQTSCATMES